jgi:hypothetical protein
MDDAADIDAFREELESTGREYRLLDRPDEKRVTLQFTGRFQDREVIWNATVVALDRHDGGADGPEARRQFIDIAPGDGVMRDIIVGLDLGQIDHPALLKTIIMIRKYKRLQVGRHEFGRPGSGT